MDFNKYGYSMIFAYQAVFAGIMIIKISNKGEDNMLESYNFWLFSGLFISGFSTVGIYLLVDYLKNSNNQLILYFFATYNFFVSLLIALLFLKAFLCLKKPIY
ncbi:MAG: hypothetical protein Q8M15_16810 [Bacteroidota bacterium]|nr:hypothetical protein [Bacteroidota bacterium]